MRGTMPPWWTYVKHIIMEYPELCLELEELKQNRVIALYGIDCRSDGTTALPVEKAALAELTPRKQKKYEAIQKAINLTYARFPENAEDRLKIIDAIYFTKEYNLSGAAVLIPCHINTAARWQGDFIRMVAEVLELP